MRVCYIAMMFLGLATSPAEALECLTYRDKGSALTKDNYYAENMDIQVDSLAGDEVGVYRTYKYLKPKLLAYVRNGTAKTILILSDIKFNYNIFEYICSNGQCSVIDLLTAGEECARLYGNCTFVASIYKHTFYCNLKPTVYNISKKFDPFEFEEDIE